MPNLHEPMATVNLFFYESFFTEYNVTPGVCWPGDMVSLQRCRLSVGHGFKLDWVECLEDRKE